MWAEIGNKKTLIPFKNELDQKIYQKNLMSNSTFSMHLLILFNKFLLFIRYILFILTYFLYYTFIIFNYNFKFILIISFCFIEINFKYSQSI